MASNEEWLKKCISDDDTSFSLWLRTHRSSFTVEVAQTLRAYIEEQMVSNDLEDVLGIIDRGQAAAQVARQPLAVAELWKARANALQFHDHHQKSLAAADEAVKLYKNYGTAFDVATASTVRVILLAELERFDEAIALGKWIEPLFAEADFNFGLARLAGAMAYVYILAWQLENALIEQQRALALYEALEMPLDIAWALHNMGVLAEQMDQLDEAEAYFRQSLPILQEHDNSVMVIKTLQNLALLDWRRAHYHSALTHLYEIQKRLTPEKISLDVGYVSMLEAQVRLHLHQPEHAKQLLVRAVTCFRELHQQARLAEALLHLSALEAGGRERQSFGAALVHLDEAENAVQPLGLSLLLAWIHLEQSEVLLHLQRKGEAEHKAAAAYQSFAEAGLPLRAAHAQLVVADSVCEQDRARADELYQQVLVQADQMITPLAVRSWLGVGELALAELRIAEAGNAFEQALTLQETIGRNLRSHSHSAGFYENVQLLYERRLQTLHLGAASAAEKFQLVERMKARALADLLLSQPVDTQMGETVQQLLAQRDHLAAALDQHVAALNRMGSRQLASAGQHRARVVAAHDSHHHAESQRLRLELLRLDETIDHHHDPTAAWRRGSTLPVKQLFDLLEQETALLSYYALNDQLYVLLVTQEAGVVALSLHSSLHELTELWQQTRRLIERPQARLTSTKRRLGKLYDLLIQPLQTHLTAIEKLVILPHRILANIPFAALFDQSRNQYLIEQFAMQTVPSATILAHCQSAVTPTTAPLLVGYPGELGQVDYLFGVQNELTMVRRHWPDAKFLYGADASLTKLMDRVSNRPLIHLAGHAFFDHDEPLSSGMPLAGGRWLRASDLYRHFGIMAGATVVLSGCNTARGHIRGADLLGLVSAFLYAGAAAVVAGLWRVDDEGTAQFMEHFYRHLIAGESTATALRKAQLTILADSSFAAPYYWAPFTLIGDSRRVAQVESQGNCEP